MCATERHNPTTEDEKNSFERTPRRLNTFPKFSRSGWEVRYSGSAAGSTSVMVRAVATAISKARPISRRMKLEYECYVLYSAPQSGQAFTDCRNNIAAASNPSLTAAPQLVFPLFVS